MCATAGRAEQQTERYLKSCASLASVCFKRFMSVNKMLLILQIFKQCAWWSDYMWPFCFSRTPYSPKDLIYTQVFAESEPNIAKPIIFCLTIYSNTRFTMAKKVCMGCVCLCLSNCNCSSWCYSNPSVIYAFFIIPSDSVGRQPCSLCLVCLMPYSNLTC